LKPSFNVIKQQALWFNWSSRFIQIGQTEKKLCHVWMSAFQLTEAERLSFCHMTKFNTIIPVLSYLTFIITWIICLINHSQRFLQTCSKRMEVLQAQLFVWLAFQWGCKSNKLQ
jgi:hypothetical protein